MNRPLKDPASIARAVADAMAATDARLRRKYGGAAKPVDRNGPREPGAAEVVRGLIEEWKGRGT